MDLTVVAAAAVVVEVVTRDLVWVSVNFGNVIEAESSGCFRLLQVEQMNLQLIQSRETVPSEGLSRGR